MPKLSKKVFNDVLFSYFLHMSDNHHIDFTVVKLQDESPFKMEINETSFSLTANLGKLVLVSFSEEILTLQFDKGHLRIDMTFEDIYRYFNLKEIKKE
ncbi:MAG: hypothetical protein JSW11_20540 [Candidatus Heimdallarchaeota archaeon]|nr:MAG: hypothetical protein JSW11_20540 [Candidatus Heimdallarchaeota archaeon]